MLFVSQSCMEHLPEQELATPSFPSAPDVTELPLTDQISQHDITWTFDREVRSGMFVNGDYYFIGPATIIDIIPSPANDRNGSILNLPPDHRRSGFDYRITKPERYDTSLRSNPPFEMIPNDILVSTVSVDVVGILPPFLINADPSSSPIAKAAILTCLDKPVPHDAFRPAYCKKESGIITSLIGEKSAPLKIYMSRNVNWDLLPNLQMVKDTPDIWTWTKRFQHPWLDVSYTGLDAPATYMPDYGREVSRAVGITTLLLMLDFPREEKEPLLINFLQYGIDLWGMVEAGHPGWTARGGHGNGRKWPIIFAGIMLNDLDMQNPYQKYPNVEFSEDMQTTYGKGWTDAKALYAGHEGGKWWTGWGEKAPYEHLPPSKWPGELGEKYRRCCTSVGWVGIALAARMMKATSIWNHDAFFDYVDRWMTEDDSLAIIEMIQTRGWDFSNPKFRQRQTWDPFVNDMWATYRFSTAIAD